MARSFVQQYDRVVNWIFQTEQNWKALVERKSNLLLLWDDLDGKLARKPWKTHCTGSRGHNLCPGHGSRQPHILPKTLRHGMLPKTSRHVDSNWNYRWSHYFNGPCSWARHSLYWRPLVCLQILWQIGWESGWKRRAKDHEYAIRRISHIQVSALHHILTFPRLVGINLKANIFVTWLPVTKRQSPPVWTITTFSMKIRLVVYHVPLQAYNSARKFCTRLLGNHGYHGNGC